MKYSMILALSLVTTTAFAESFFYHFAESGCSTKPQRFSTLAEMCDGLTNDTLNSNCAPQLRLKKFQEAKCPGVFKSNPESESSETISCQGLVEGFGQKIIIDKTFNWDGKSSAKWRLLVPKDIPYNPVGIYEFEVANTPNGLIAGLYALFIDNNKGLHLIGEFNGSLTIKHTDGKSFVPQDVLEKQKVELSPRRVVLSCSRSHPKPVTLSSSPHYCLGRGKSKQNEKLLMMAPKFEIKNAPLTQEMTLIQENEAPPPFVATVSLSPQINSIKTTVSLNKINGDEMSTASGSITGSSEIQLRYVEAWQDLVSEFRCFNEDTLNAERKRAGQ